MALDSGPDIGQSGFSAHIPDCFTSLEQAQNSLYFQKNRCLHAAFEIGSTITAETFTEVDQNFLDMYEERCDFFEDVLRRWSSAFQAFLDVHRSSMNSASTQGAAVLRINQLMTNLTIRSYRDRRYNQHRSWDKHKDVCEEIVSLATTVVQLQTATDKRSDTSMKGPQFSMDIGIIAPLYNVVHLCRDPCLRRKIIDLLYGALRQEGLWHSLITARVCEKIMLVEEAGLAEVKTADDIPESNRIVEVDMQFDTQGRKGYLTFGRDDRCSEKLAGPVLKEVIEW